MNFPHDQYLAEQVLRSRLAALVAERDLIVRAITIIAALAALQAQVKSGDGK